MYLAHELDTTYKYAKQKLLQNTRLPDPKAAAQYKNAVNGVTVYSCLAGAALGVPSPF